MQKAFKRDALPTPRFRWLLFLPTHNQLINVLFKQKMNEIKSNFTIRIKLTF